MSMILDFLQSMLYKMERTKDGLLWLEKILPILGLIDKLSCEEKKDLLELLTLDLDEKSRSEYLNQNETEEEKIRDLASAITSDYFIN